jgi:hypothetical protein
MSQAPNGFQASKRVLWNHEGGTIIRKVLSGELDDYYYHPHKAIRRATHRRREADLTGIFVRLHPVRPQVDRLQ